jgi:hypothetical protein
MSSQSTDTCSWYGISCDENGDVLIGAFGKSSMIPSSLNRSIKGHPFNFCYYVLFLFVERIPTYRSKYLAASYFRSILSILHFTLQIMICLLSNVEMIILSANNLAGSFPLCISTSMTSLKELHINGNKLSGALPAGLHKLPNLTRLTLSFNYLTEMLFRCFLTYSRVTLSFKN